MPRRGVDSGFSGPLSTIAVVGIALGVVVMVMAVSILRGFQQDITEKVVGFGSHITVTAYDASDQPLQSRTFADVPIRNGYVTTYQGTFFIDSPMTASFTVADWQEYDAVTF